MKSEKQKKVAEYLFKYSVNTSSRKESRPKEYEDVVSNGKKISNIALDLNVSYNQLTIRTKFVGSDKYFAFGFNTEDYDYWSKIMSEFIICKPEIDFDTLDTKDSEQPLQAYAPVVVDNYDGLCAKCMQRECVCD